MAHNVSSKRANIFLAVEGRLWYSVEKPLWCCLAAPIKEEVTGPKALVAAPPPEEFHLCWKWRADLGSAALDRGWHVVMMKYFTQFLWDVALQSGFRTGNTLNIVHKGVNKVKGAFRSICHCLFFFRCLSTQQSHLEGWQRNERFPESERTWLALEWLQGKVFVVQKQTSQIDLQHHCKSTNKSSCVL